MDFISFLYLGPVASFCILFFIAFQVVFGVEKKSNIVKFQSSATNGVHAT